MNPEWKAKWLAALRSGKYKQTSKYLRTEEGYCCLGVLCDLVAPDQWGVSNSISGAITHGNNPYSGVGYPSSKVLEQVGIDDSDCKDLARLNDMGKSFAEIADTIDLDL